MKKNKLSLKEIKNILEHHKVFDKTYYLKQNSDARLASITPIDHYCKIGIQNDRKPNANFDPKWYTEYYTDVKEDASFPIIHYLIHGQLENRFVNEKEKNNYELIINSGVFDEDYYKNTNLDLKDLDEYFNLLIHFVRYGMYEGRKPFEAFDFEWYQEFYIDVKLQGLNPIIHYIKVGLKENHFCNEKEKHEYEYLSDSKLFDEEFYKKEYEDLNKQDVEFDYLFHYVRYGKNEGRYINETKNNNDKVGNECRYEIAKKDLIKIRKGLKRFHPIFPPFDEKNYIRQNKDVEKLIKKNLFNSGFDHFCKYGYNQILNGKRNYKDVK